MELLEIITLTDEAFENQLNDWLCEHSESLPLEDACEHGGFPDAGDVNITGITKSYEDEDEVWIDFDVSFTEEVGTTCANCTVPFSHNVDCRMKVMKDDLLLDFFEIEVRAVEHEDDEPLYEF